MNRFFTRTELADAYRLPQHVQDQLLAEVAAVEKDDQGEPLLLEAHVEAWLADQYGAVPGRRVGKDFLTIREVAQLLRCSYTEARDRMLDGRIKAIKEGTGCGLARSGSSSTSPPSPSSRPTRK